MFKSDDTIQAKAYHAIDKVHKQLSGEAIIHITTAKMMHKPVNTDITNICSTGCKPKNYPALMNGGYYVDHANIMGMMGLTAIITRHGIVLFLWLVPM